MSFLNALRPFSLQKMALHAMKADIFKTAPERWGLSEKNFFFKTF